MSAAVLTDVSILLGAGSPATAMDLTNYTGSFDPNIMTAMQEANHFGGRGYRIVLPGLTNATTALEGHADYASGAVSATFNTSSKGTQALFGAIPTGSAQAVGDSAIMIEGRLQAGKMLTGNVGEVADFSMAIESDAAPIDGFVAAPLASRTTSGFTGTGINYTAGVPAGKSLYAGVWVTAAAGTNLVVKIQSDDNSGFTTAVDRITFSTVSAVGWQFLSVAGSAALATETWWRATATIASVTFTFAVILGVI